MFKGLFGDQVINTAYEKSTAGGVDEAVALLRHAARNSDPQGQRTEAMGTIFYQAGRYQEAAEAFARSLPLEPANMGRLNYLCSALSRSGQWDKAFALLDEYASTYPNDVAPPSIRCLIISEKTEGDYGDALKAYDEARRIFSRHHTQDCLSMGFLQQCADMAETLSRKPE